MDWIADGSLDQAMDAAGVEEAEVDPAKHPRDPGGKVVRLG